jgi:uncharacterized protein YecE (DUF72 family)
LKPERVGIELRNRGWVSEERLSDTERFFRVREICFVTVDGPDDPHFTVMPSIDLVSSDKLAYMRAHGRNAEGYVRGRAVPVRFSYIYSHEELRNVVERATKAAEKASDVHIVYNNNKADYAPRAAALTRQILEKESVLEEESYSGNRELVYG